MPGQKEQSVDPILDLLIRHSFPEVAAAIREQTDQIILTWEEAVLAMMPEEARLSESQLRDHLPQILTLLADVLNEDNPGETRRLLESPQQHGVTRFDQHYNIDQFISEYRVLRRVIVERSQTALGRTLTTTEGLALDMAVDDMLQRGVVIFVQHQEARLRSATEAEKKYLSFLSHDLRNNLNAVILDLEILKRQLRGTPEFVQEASDLELTQQSIFDTVDGMDRLLKAEQLRKGPKPKKTAVDLHALVMAVSHHFQTRAARKGIQIAVEAPSSATIESDREWLTLVLHNLVGNAVKFSTEGTIRILVCFEGPGQGHRCILSVSDEGPGIAHENLSRIFETFERGETHGSGGVGLGLAIASQAAKLLGGELTVESTMGAGSTFHLLIPITKP